MRINRTTFTRRDPRWLNSRLPSFLLVFWGVVNYPIFGEVGGEQESKVLINQPYAVDT